MNISPPDERGEIGGTGDSNSELGSASVSSSNVESCDACEGCDDVCDSKYCPKCEAKRSRGLSEGPMCRYGYTRCQVARHNKREDCWLIAHMRVYDATRFIDMHPAGPKPILSRAGQDVSVDYDFHSLVAQRQYWKPLCIGRLVKCPLRDRGDSSFSQYSCTIQ